MFSIQGLTPPLVLDHELKMEYCVNFLKPSVSVHYKYLHWNIEYFLFKGDLTKTIR